METKEKRGINKLIIILILVIIIALLVGAVYFLFFKDGIPELEIAEKPKVEHTVSLDEFVVNLKSTSPEDNYLKISIALMYTDDEYTEAINSNVNKIRDIIINNLRVNTKSDLLDNGSIASLKTNIKEDINTTFDSVEVEDVYITDIIVQ